jgi:putative transcriptional regulator
MAKSAFDTIMAGLQDAIAHKAGKKGRGRERQVCVEVPDVKKIRDTLNLTQDEFAVAFEVPVGTVRNWEQGRRQPEGPARALLRVVEKNPTVVIKALLPARAAGVAKRDKAPRKETAARR